jgi:hypothetical protein
MKEINEGFFAMGFIQEEAITSDVDQSSTSTFPREKELSPKQREYCLTSRRNDEELQLSKDNCLKRPTMVNMP